MDESSVVGLEGGYAQKGAETCSEERKQVTEQRGEDGLIKTEGERLPDAVRRERTNVFCAVCLVCASSFLFARTDLSSGYFQGKERDVHFPPRINLLHSFSQGQRLLLQYKITTEPKQASVGPGPDGATAFWRVPAPPGSWSSGPESGLHLVSSLGPSRSAVGSTLAPV